MSPSKITKPEPVEDYVIFKAYAGGSPAKSYNSLIELYDSGKLAFSGTFSEKYSKSEVDKKTLAKIKRLISTIMERKCSGSDGHRVRGPLFYWTLRFGNKIKTIYSEYYQKCYKKELFEIEELITGE